MTEDHDAHTFTHRQIITIVVGLMLGMFLAALDQTVVSTAIRTIADDLDGFALQAWATTAFLITSTITTPLYGKLSDIYGRRPLYLTAIVLFIIGSMLCGLAQSMYQLAAFRAFQGLGAGGLFSLAIAIVGDIVPPRERSKYMGYFMAAFGTSSVLGPVVGGLLAGTETLLGIAGWRWIFYVNVPIGLAALVVVSRGLHLPRHRLDHRIDWLGAFSLVVCLVPLLTVAEQGREWGWGSTGAIICYGIGLVGLALFFIAERKVGDEALLPLKMFKVPSVAIGTTGSFVVGMGMFGAMGMLPLYLQVVKGSTPTVAGLQTLPLVVGIILAAMISGQLIAKTGKYKKFPVIGSALMTLALLAFSQISADTSLAVVMAMMLVFGVGLGCNMQPLILSVQNAVQPKEIGVATSSVTFFRQMGGTLGVAVFLSILFTVLVGNIDDAMQEARTTPSFQQALAEHPDQAALLREGGHDALTDSSFITHLDERIAHPFRVGFSESMDVVFLFGAVVMALGFLVLSRLPEIPLRDQSGIQARRAAAAEDAAAGPLM